MPRTGLNMDMLTFRNEDLFWMEKDDTLLRLQRRVAAAKVQAQHPDLESGRRNAAETSASGDDVSEPHHESDRIDPALAAKNKLSIFVSVVSYRDPLCPYTVRSLFSQAFNPGTVFVGLVEQHDTKAGDPICVADPVWKSPRGEMVHVADANDDGMSQEDARFSDSGVGSSKVQLVHSHVKVLRMHPRFSKGPIHARYFAAQMYGGENYFLMIDSHSQFTLHWDKLVISMYLTAEAQSQLAGTSGLNGPVITHHPPMWTKTNSDEDDHDAALLLRDDGPADGSVAAGALQEKQRQMPFVCKATFDYPEYGFPVLRSLPHKPVDHPVPQPFVGAGFLFSGAHMLRDTPFDPHLPYLFHGEEILLSARLWTAGFDFYAPHRTIVKHYYYRRESPKYHDDRQYRKTRPLAGDVDDNFTVVDQRSQSEANSVRRVQYILQSTVYMPPSQRKSGEPLQKYASEGSVPEEVKKDAEWYGLGTERSLKAFWEHVGVDPIERRHDTSLWCCEPPLAGCNN